MLARVATVSVMDTCALLARTSLFSTLEADTLQHLADRCSRQTYPAGATLFVAGDSGDEMFVVVAGSVKVSVASEDGDITLATFGPGDIFGELALLTTGGQRTATAAVVGPSELLVIHRREFETVLRASPDFVYRLLCEVATRLKRRNKLVTPLADGASHIGASRQGKTPLGHGVTLVGYGRYASLHIGPKYAIRNELWHMSAIVDPVLTRSRYGISRLGVARADVPIYPTFDVWQDYFDTLDDDGKAEHVVEIALRPDLVYDQTLLYLRAGVRNVILPKPVATSRELLERLTEEVAKRRVKAAVASQWYYSDLPRIIRREIKRAAGRPDADLADIRLDRVELEFSKENGVAISATPPLSELPHALQLLDTIGLVDLAHHEPEVSGDAILVDVVYRPTNITSGVHVRASLDWTPEDEVKAQYPDWDVQNRSMRIYVRDGQQEPSLVVDFWVKFDRTGRFAIRPGRLIVPESDEPHARNSVVLEFVDDQLLTMLRKIYTAFHQSFQEFQRDDTILSLDRYAHVGRQLMTIEQAWTECLEQPLRSGT
ncbi:MAG TPA: cyclic nucleotide-binding domain-containing protein [Chloroflexota bacterium]|jgi:CRP-like cAMP-binding protein